MGWLLADVYEPADGSEVDLRRPDHAVGYVRHHEQQGGTLSGPTLDEAVESARAALTTEVEEGEVNAGPVERHRTAIRLFDELHAGGRQDLDFDVSRDGPVQATPDAMKQHRKDQRAEMGRGLAAACYEEEYGHPPPDVREEPDAAMKTIEAVEDRGERWALGVAARDAYQRLREDSSPAIAGSSPRTTDIEGNLSTINGTSVTDDPDRLRAALELDREVFEKDNSAETADYLATAVYRQERKEELADEAEAAEGNGLDDVDPDELVLTDRGIEVHRRSVTRIGDEEALAETQGFWSRFVDTPGPPDLDESSRTDLARQAEEDEDVELESVDPDDVHATRNGVVVVEEERTLVRESERDGPATPLSPREDPLEPDLTDPEEAERFVEVVSEREGEASLAAREAAERAVAGLTTPIGDGTQDREAVATEIAAASPHDGPAATLADRRADDDRATGDRDVDVEESRESSQGW